MRNADLDFGLAAHHQAMLRAEADEERRAGLLHRSSRLRDWAGALLIACGRLLIRCGERMRRTGQAAYAER